MTKKDYILIGDALRNSRPSKRYPMWDSKMYEIWLFTLNEIALTLRLDNPRFDLDRFVNCVKED